MKTEQTKGQRRMAIVQDAILQLQIGAYQTNGNEYVVLSEAIKIIGGKNIDIQAQQLLNDISVNNFCDVCAKGSLFLSTIRKENDLTFGEIRSSFLAMKERLTKNDLFSEYNINLIEIYYENWKIDIHERISEWVADGRAFFYCYDSDAGVGPYEEMLKFKDDHNRKIVEVNNQYRERKDRLLFILNNMLENDGVFKPV